MSTEPAVTVVEVDPYAGWTGPDHPPILDWWCAYHHRQEIPSHPDVAITCGECWHVYASPADLEAQYAALGPEFRPRAAAEIFACPVCSHDF